MGELDLLPPGALETVDEKTRQEIVVDQFAEDRRNRRLEKAASIVTYGFIALIALDLLKGNGWNPFMAILSLLTPAGIISVIQAFAVIYGLRMVVGGKGMLNESNALAGIFMGRTPIKGTPARIYGILLLMLGLLPTIISWLASLVGLVL